jgi:PAS domain S-box-containing protein
MSKKSRKHKILSAAALNTKATYVNKVLFNKLAESLPQYIFWKDENSVYLGCNKNYANFIGLDSPDDIIGKTDYDLSWQANGHTAETFRRDDRETLFGSAITNKEEILILPNGAKLITLVSKLPIVDDHGKAIGIVGYFTDITESRHAEERIKQTELENATYKAQLKAQQQFTRTAHQVAHDIRSPLASLLMIVKSCQEMPEMERIALREAAMGIGDIANNLLSKYNLEDQNHTVYNEEPQAILLSTTLLQLLTDKKIQYKDLPVTFDCDFKAGEQFAFINVDASSFKRMMSNLINNAVEALKNKKGRVVIKLETSPRLVKIIVQDNGEGMPREIVDKIMHHVAVTNKKGGHGIGFIQVHETLVRNAGKMAIYSTLGQGSKVILEFPRTTAPTWIAEWIKLGREDLVIILDDDASIHVAWASRFKPILKKAPQIQIHHFTICDEAIQFINRLPPVEKNKVFLLTDFELLKQELSGLHVVQKTQVQRSILVTSHYANVLIQEQAAKIGTKILPKQLASEVKIIIDEEMRYSTNKPLDSKSLKIVDLILVEDDKSLARDLMTFIFFENSVDYFESPDDLRKNLGHYSKDTRIYLDNQFSSGKVNGLDFAKELHKLGYTRLYLLSGSVFPANQIPSYLKVIRKDDTEHIKDW